MGNKIGHDPYSHKSCHTGEDRKTSKRIIQLNVNLQQGQEL